MYNIQNCTFLLYRISKSERKKWKKKEKKEKRKKEKNERKKQRKEGHRISVKNLPRPNINNSNGPGEFRRSIDRS